MDDLIPPPFPTLQPKRLYKQIADLIAQRIAAGVFPPHSNLPPERDLAQQLGVSRSSVREALIALEVQGVIEIRMSSGIFVCPPKKQLPPESSGADIGPFDMLEARAIIEGEIAALAAKRATSEQLMQLHDVLDSVDLTGDIDTYYESDKRFHLALAEASGNPALVEMVETLWKKRASPLFRQFQSHYSDRRTIHNVHDDHLAVLLAIEQRDMAKARLAMTAHLDHVRQEFLASGESETQ